jgi:hypothetical protein
MSSALQPGKGLPSHSDTHTSLSEHDENEFASLAEHDAPWFTENYYTTKNLSTRALRGNYIKIMVAMSALVLLAMMAILPIYWGALWKSPQHAHGLNAWVIVRSRFLSYCI